MSFLYNIDLDLFQRCWPYGQPRPAQGLPALQPDKDSNKLTPSPDQIKDKEGRWKPVRSQHHHHQHQQSFSYDNFFEFGPNPAESHYLVPIHQTSSDCKGLAVTYLTQEYLDWSETRTCCLSRLLCSFWQKVLKFWLLLIDDHFYLLLMCLKMTRKAVRSVVHSKHFY